MITGALRPGHRGGGNHGVGRGDARIQRFLLLGLFFGGELAGIAAGAVGADAGFDELGAQRLHLFAGGATNVIRLDHGAQAPRGGDGLQPRHAGADDQRLRRADGAGGRGQHGHELFEVVGGDQHGLVAGQRGLRGQAVHRLGAGDARNELDREAGDLAVAQRLHLGLARVGLQEADHHGAGFELADLLEAERRDRQQDVGLRQDRRPNYRAHSPFL